MIIVPEVIESRVYVTRESKVIRQVQRVYLEPLE